MKERLIVHKAQFMRKRESGKEESRKAGMRKAGKCDEEEGENLPKQGPKKNQRKKYEKENMGKRRWMDG